MPLLFVVRSRLRILLALLVGLLSACADILGSDVPKQEGPWIRATAVVLDRGDSVQMTAALLVRTWDVGAYQQQIEWPLEAGRRWPRGLDVRWSSSDPSVAEIGKDGVLRARGPGRATIRMEAGRERDSALVAVRPVPGTAAVRYTMVEAGNDLSCGLTEDGRALCWGRVPEGVRHEGTRVQASPTGVSGAPPLVALAVGGGHACGLAAGGAAYCWGANRAGQLGNRTEKPSAAAVAVHTEHRFTRISAGAGHTCALTADGKAYCWGAGANGELGTPVRGNRVSAPVEVETELRFREIGAGENRTCGLAADGRAACWGLRYVTGPSGVVEPKYDPRPAYVEGNLSFRSLRVGPHVCGVTADGGAYCWGGNQYGQLGDGSRTMAVAPRRVAGGLKLARISAGWGHTCGVTADGMAYCWGFNYYGELGNGAAEGPRDDRLDVHVVPSPAAVAGGHTFRALDAGGSHTCGVTVRAEVLCWGGAGAGALGTGAIPRPRESRRGFTSVPARVAEPL
ncbi:MAG TPA: hypothetical protein VGR37_06505 [Longimicrobiaceae bacterium]|nr:hypothetical protein [Longimicrobiaceae bacterium]